MKLGIIKFLSAFILLSPFFQVVFAETSFVDARDTETDLELTPVPAPESIPDPIQDSLTQSQDQENQPQTEADNQQPLPTSDPASVPSSNSEPSPDPVQDSSTQPQDQGNQHQTVADNQQPAASTDSTSVPSSTSEPSPDPVQDSSTQPQDHGDQHQTEADNQQPATSSDSTSVPSSTSEPSPDPVQDSSTQPQDHGDQHQTEADNQQPATSTDSTSVPSSTSQPAPEQAQESSIQLQAQGNQAQIQQNQELPSQEKTNMATEPDKQQAAVDQQKADNARDQPSDNQRKDDMQQNVSTTQRAPANKISAMEDQEAYQARALEEVQRRKQLQTEAAKQKLFVAKHKKIEAQRLAQDAMERQETERKLANDDGQLNNDKVALRKIPKDSKSQDIREAQNSAANNDQKNGQGQDTPGTAEDRDLEQEIARNEEKLAMLRLKFKNKHGHVKKADDINSSHKGMHSLSSLDEHGNIVQHEDSKPGIDVDKNLTIKNASQNSQTQLVGKQQKHTDGKDNPKIQ